MLIEILKITGGCILKVVGNGGSKGIVNKAGVNVISPVWCIFCVDVRTSWVSLLFVRSMVVSGKSLGICIGVSRRSSVLVGRQIVSGVCGPRKLLRKSPNTGGFILVRCVRTIDLL